jgi:hypothetical protein
MSSSGKFLFFIVPFMKPDRISNGKLTVNGASIFPWFDPIKFRLEILRPYFENMYFAHFFASQSPQFITLKSRTFSLETIKHFGKSLASVAHSGVVKQ